MFLGLVLVWHLNETEIPGLSRELVLDDVALLLYAFGPP
jgi:hypothetical protein